MNINSIANKIKFMLPEGKISILLITTAIAISMISHVDVNNKIQSELIFANSIEEVNKIEIQNDTFVMKILESTGKPFSNVINIILKTTNSIEEDSSLEQLIENKKSEINQDFSISQY